MVCLGKGQLSVLDPMDKIPQDENKIKSSHGLHSFSCDSCQFFDKTEFIKTQWHFEYLQLACYLFVPKHKWSCTSFSIIIAPKHFSVVVCMQLTNVCILCLRYMSIYHFCKLCSEHHQIGPHQFIFKKCQCHHHCLTAGVTKKATGNIFSKRNHHANGKCDLLCTIAEMPNKN